MQASDPESGSGAAPAEGGPEGVARSGGPGHTDQIAGRPVRLWVWALAAGIVAGIVAWLGGEVVYGTFAPPSELTGALERSAELVRAQTTAHIQNATLAFGLLGAVLGLALGGAGGGAQRSGRAVLVAGGVGVLAGTAAGVGMSLVLVPIGEWDPILASESLLLPLVIHGGIWSAIGAAGGLAFGLGLGGGRGTVARALLGGLMGALLGTVAYDLVGALAFPLAGTSRAISMTWTTRLLARLAVTVPVALGAALAVQGSRGRPASPP